MLKEEKELKEVEAILEGWYKYDDHGYLIEVSMANINK